MTKEIIAATIGAIGAVTAAIIGAKATTKASRTKKPKYKEEKHEALDIPEIPCANTNPFDLPPEDQEFGGEEYIEALGTRLLESRNANDIHIRKITKE